MAEEDENNFNEYIIKDATDNAGNEQYVFHLSSLVPGNSYLGKNEFSTHKDAWEATKIAFAAYKQGKNEIRHELRTILQVPHEKYRGSR